MYKKSIVIFIDILGFKNLVEQSETHKEIFAKIQRTLKKFKSLEDPLSWPSDLIEVEEDAQMKGLQGFDISRKTKCTCFFDSIVVSIEVGNDLNKPELFTNSDNP